MLEDSIVLEARVNPLNWISPVAQKKVIQSFRWSMISISFLDCYQHVVFGYKGYTLQKWKNINNFLRFRWYFNWMQPIMKGWTPKWATNSSLFLTSIYFFAIWIIAWDIASFEKFINSFWKAAMFVKVEKQTRNTIFLCWNFQKNTYCASSRIMLNRCCMNIKEKSWTIACFLLFWI